MRGSLSRIAFLVCLSGFAIGSARGDFRGHCARILKSAIDPISSLVDVGRSILVHPGVPFDRVAYGRALEIGPSLRRPPETIEELLGGIDAILREERYRFSLARVLTESGRGDRSRILADLRGILESERNTVSRKAIVDLAKGVYAVQNGLPYHTYVALSRLPGEAIDRIALSRAERFLAVSSFSSAIRLMGYQVVDRSPFWASRMLGYVQWALAIPAKAVGFGEPEIRILRLKAGEARYRELLATAGYEATMRELFEESGAKLRNEARFNYALALSGAGFSLYGTWTLVEWVASCDDGRTLPLGVLPSKPCGEAKRLPVEEIRARLLERWKRDQEAMGETIGPDDIDYRAQIENYLLMSEEELRRLWTKVDSKD